MANWLNKVVKAHVDFVTLGQGDKIKNSLTPPSRDMSGMDQALAMIESQYGNINKYFEQAGKDLETQFGALKGRTMTDAVNTLATTGIYDSPVSEYQLNRTRQGLEETYSTAKSNLAGQKMSALSGIDSQKIGYYQNLADMQYQDSLTKYQSKMQLIGAGASVLGAIL
jgi:hypothetical protein